MAGVFVFPILFLVSLHSAAVSKGMDVCEFEEMFPGETDSCFKPGDADLESLTNVTEDPKGGTEKETTEDHYASTIHALHHTTDAGSESPTDMTKKPMGGTGPQTAENHYASTIPALHYTTVAESEPSTVVTTYQMGDTETDTTDGYISTIHALDYTTGADSASSTDVTTDETEDYFASTTPALDRTTEEDMTVRANFVVDDKCTRRGSCNTANRISSCRDGTWLGPQNCRCSEVLLADRGNDPSPGSSCQCFWSNVNPNVSVSYGSEEEPVVWPNDCQEIQTTCGRGSPGSGIYLIKPEGAVEPFPVFCNNSVDGGGWTVFQRRLDGSVDFYRYWDAYKSGFGFLHTEFWLGNDKLHLLTEQGDHVLRIDMNDKFGDSYYAEYTSFQIGDEDSNYMLNSVGTFSGTARNDRLANHVGYGFTTRDQDNDPVYGNDAERCHGAWWFSNQNCQNVDNDISNLNGQFNGAGHQSIYWDDLNGDLNNIQTSLKYTEMKIRPHV